MFVLFYLIASQSLSGRAQAGQPHQSLLSSEEKWP